MARDHEAQDKVTTVGPVTSGIQRNIETVAQIETAVMDERSRGERIIRYLTRRVGTVPVVVAHCVIVFAWIGWNADTPHRFWAFDPPPFSLLSMVVSVEGILLGLLILASQNRLQHEADRRAHLELQINLMAESENTRTLHLLDALCRHFGVASEGEDLVDELKAEIDLAMIADSLKSTLPSET